MISEITKTYRTSLEPDHAKAIIERAIMSWKLGRAFGLKHTHPGEYTATHAMKQTGSFVRFEVAKATTGTIASVTVGAAKWSLKNPMAGVIGRIERALVEADPSTQLS
jgi:hypothetical protein